MIHNLLRRLERVTPHGDNRWMALCPAHKDKNPSLSITLRDDRILVCCHAQCDTSDVLKAIGLKFTDLYSDENRAAYNKAVSHAALRLDKKTKTDRKERDRLILALGDAKRQYGERLSKRELRIEREAYQRYHANNY